MNFTLIGATGWIGSHILNEARSRGHEVRAVARAIAGLMGIPGIQPRRADMNDPESLAEVLREGATVVSSVPFLAFDPEVLLDGLTRARVARYVCVGGAGSLKLADGTDLVDSPGFPSEYRDEALAGRSFLERLRAKADLDWVFLSPSAIVEDGPRRGRVRLGGDTLLIDPDGHSRISVADYASALVDELEQPRHHRVRFTVGY